MELVKVDRLYVERTSRKCIVILGGPRLERGLGSSYRSGRRPYWRSRRTGSTTAAACTKR